MSSAAKAKPVVLGVGVADAGGAEADGNAGTDDGEATVGEGDAAGLGLELVDVQPVTSSAVAKSSERRL